MHFIILSFHLNIHVLTHSSNHLSIQFIAELYKWIKFTPCNDSNPQHDAFKGFRSPLEIFGQHRVKLVYAAPLQLQRNINTMRRKTTVTLEGDIQQWCRYPFHCDLEPPMRLGQETTLPDFDCKRTVDA